MKETTERLNKALSDFNEQMLEELGVNDPQTWANMSESNIVSLYHLIKLTEAVKEYTEKTTNMIEMLENKIDILLSTC